MPAIDVFPSAMSHTKKVFVASYFSTSAISHHLVLAFSLSSGCHFFVLVIFSQVLNFSFGFSFACEWLEILFSSIFTSPRLHYHPLLHSMAIQLFAWLLTFHVCYSVFTSSQELIVIGRLSIKGEAQTILKKYFWK